MKDEPNQNLNPQYEKYIKCHVYRIHPGTFGNHCCDDQWQGNSGGGCGSHGQDGSGCIGPGDPVPLVMDGTSLMQKSLMIRHPVWISRTSAHLMTTDLTC